MEKDECTQKDLVMNGLKSSFIQLPPRLSVPTLPPSTPLQCRTPSPSPTPQHTHTLAHINTHTPCPAPWRTQAGGCEWVGFPNYLNRFQQMVEELSSWGHVAHSPKYCLLCNGPDRLHISLPSLPKKLSQLLEQAKGSPQTVNSFSVTPKTETLSGPASSPRFSTLSSPAVLHCGIRHPASSFSGDGESCPPTF